MSRPSQVKYHPHKEEDRRLLKDEGRLDKQSADYEQIEDVKDIMSTGSGRREAYRLLREGMRLPDQRISNTNGSLQSYQLGRSDALRTFDERIRVHCNQQWIKMIEENEPTEIQQ